MDLFLLALILLVLAPRLTRSSKAAINHLAKRGPFLLDYLDQASAPLWFRALLRWLLGPLEWLAKQMNREKSMGDITAGPSVPDVPDPFGILDSGSVDSAGDEDA
mgnify:CR=1 FL=1